MAPQAIPLGVLVTVPVPLPSRVTVSVADCAAKFAVTVVAVESVTTQAPVPEHPAPLQPVKTEPEAAPAVRVAVAAARIAPRARGPQRDAAGRAGDGPLPPPALVDGEHDRALPAAGRRSP